MSAPNSCPNVGATCRCSPSRSLSTYIVYVYEINFDINYSWISPQCNVN